MEGSGASSTPRLRLRLQLWSSFDVGNTVQNVHCFKIDGWAQARAGAKYRVKKSPSVLCSCGCWTPVSVKMLAQPCVQSSLAPCVYTYALFGTGNKMASNGRLSQFSQYTALPLSPSIWLLSCQQLEDYGWLWRILSLRHLRVGLKKKPQRKPPNNIPNTLERHWHTKTYLKICRNFQKAEHKGC